MLLSAIAKSSEIHLDVTFHRQKYKKLAINIRDATITATATIYARLFSAKSRISRADLTGDVKTTWLLLSGRSHSIIHQGISAYFPRFAEPFFSHSFFSTST